MRGIDVLLLSAIILEVLLSQAATSIARDVRLIARSDENRGVALFACVMAKNYRGPPPDYGFDRIEPYS